MRRLVCLVPLLLLAAVIPFVRVSAQPPLKAEVKKAKKIAVLVGTNEYTDRALPSLRFCEADMLALKAELEKAGFTVILLLGSGKGDAEATRQNIDDTLVNDDEKNAKYAFRNLTSDDDVALVAFSGHGQQIIVSEGGKDVETPFYCPKRAKNGVPETLVSLNAVLRGLNGTKAKGLLLVDACRQFTERKELDGQKSAKGLGLDRSVVQGLRKNVGGMFACDDRQAAIEIELDPKNKTGHGAFFQAVLTTLRSADGELTWEEVVPKVRKQVNALTGHVDEQDRQKPQSFGSFSVEVVLVPKGLATARKGGEEVEFEIADGVKMVFCWIPPGECQLGSPQAEREAVMKQTGAKEESASLKAQAEGMRGKYAERKGFWMGKYEVTQGEWVALMNNNPSAFVKNSGNAEVQRLVARLETNRFPVENVNWSDCQKYLKLLNAQVGAKLVFGRAGQFAVPTMDRWEYAYRGGKGNTTPFYWGKTLNGTEANCDGTQPYGTETKGPNLGRTTTVGAYESQVKHPWGLCDMTGNVWEWCEGWYDAEHTERVCCGNSWNNQAMWCRPVQLANCRPDVRESFIGFRVCYFPE